MKFENSDSVRKMSSAWEEQPRVWEKVGKLMKGEAEVLQNTWSSLMGSGVYGP